MASEHASRAVIAMRIRLGLLRLKMTVDAERLVNDAAYSAGVLAQCRQSGNVELAKLADRFEFGGDSQLTQPPQPESGESGSGNSRLDSGFAASSRFSTGGAATRPAGETDTGGATQSPNTQQPHTGSTGSEGGDPNDPNSPRNRRYLRGAR